MGLRQRIQHVFAHLSLRFDTGRPDEPQFTPVHPAYLPPEKSYCETASSFSATIQARRQTWDPPPEYDVLPSAENYATASSSETPRRNVLFATHSVASVSSINVSVRVVGEYSGKYIRRYLASIGSRLLPPDTPASEVRAVKPMYLSY